MSALIDSSEQGHPPLRVMIVDDQASFRQAARGILEKEPDMKIVAEADDGTQAVDLIDDVDLDLVLMDVQMPAMNGFEATRRILELQPAVTVVLTSTSSDKEYGRLAAEAGAVTFVAKRDLKADVLRDAVAGRR